MAATAEKHISSVESPRPSSGEKDWLLDRAEEMIRIGGGEEEAQGGKRGFSELEGEGKPDKRAEREVRQGFVAGVVVVVEGSS